MRKEIIECDLCGVEIESKSDFYYMLNRKRLIMIGLYDGPDQMDICKYCIENFLDPLGKWSELGQDESEPEKDPVLGDLTDLPF